MKLFRSLDVLVAAYFLFLFPIRPIGWLVALLIGYRLWKDVTGPPESIPFHFGGAR